MMEPAVNFDCNMAEVRPGDVMTLLVLNALLYKQYTQIHKIVEVLKKTIKLIKTAPTCFGSRRNHHQGATTSTWLKLQVNYVVSVMAAYAAITLTTSILTRTVEQDL